MQIVKQLFFLPILLIAIMIVVNQFSGVPTNRASTEVCTRYCHNSTCPHFEKDKASKARLRLLEGLYFKNIQWLKNNPLGISYQQMNLLVYVVAFPAVWLLLIWNLLRIKKYKIGRNEELN